MTDHTASPDHLSPDERLALAFSSLDDSDVRLETPPAEVWQAITDQIAHFEAPAPTADSNAADAPGTADAPDTTDIPAAPDATVTALNRRFVSFKILTIAAGLTVIAVAVLSSPLFSNESTDAGQVVLDAEPKPPAVTPIAIADLEALEAGVQTATAELLDDRTMIVQPDLADREGGYYEVWLLDATATQLVSLGPLREDGRYTVPPGVSINDFPVVDISIEAADGNPAHSGRSVLRGTLA